MSASEQPTIDIIIDDENEADKNINQVATSQDVAQERENSASSDSRCSICLGEMENKSFTDSCFHMFCFVCLLEWSRVKAVCPLCKQTFKSIIHNVRSFNEYDQYAVKPGHETLSVVTEEEQRFRYSSTLTTDRLAYERRREIMRQAASLRRPARHGISASRPSTGTSAFRRYVYTTGSVVPNMVSGARANISAEFYAMNPACVHRLVPWLNRELNVLLNDAAVDVYQVLQMILTLVKQVDLTGEEFYTHLYPFLGRRTHHFMHEFHSFASSGMDMAQYDQRCVYREQEDGLRDAVVVDLSPPNNDRGGTSSGSSAVRDSHGRRRLGATETRSYHNSRSRERRRRSVSVEIAPRVSDDSYSTRYELRSLETADISRSSSRRARARESRARRLERIEISPGSSHASDSWDSGIRRSERRSESAKNVSRTILSSRRRESRIIVSESSGSSSGSSGEDILGRSESPVHRVASSSQAAGSRDNRLIRESPSEGSSKRHHNFVDESELYRQSAALVPLSASSSPDEGTSSGRHLFREEYRYKTRSYSRNQKLTESLMANNQHKRVRSRERDHRQAAALTPIPCEWQSTPESSDDDDDVVILSSVESSQILEENSRRASNMGVECLTNEASGSHSTGINNTNDRQKSSTGNKSKSSGLSFILKQRSVPSVTAASRWDSDDEDEESDRFLRPARSPPPVSGSSLSGTLNDVLVSLISGASSSSSGVRPEISGASSSLSWATYEMSGPSTTSRAATNISSIQPENTTVKRLFGKHRALLSVKGKMPLKKSTGLPFWYNTYESSSRNKGVLNLSQTFAERDQLVGSDSGSDIEVVAFEKPWEKKTPINLDSDDDDVIDCDQHFTDGSENCTGNYVDNGRSNQSNIKLSALSSDLDGGMPNSSHVESTMLDEGREDQSVAHQNVVQPFESSTAAVNCQRDTLISVGSDGINTVTGSDEITSKNVGVYDCSSKTSGFEIGEEASNGSEILPVDSICDEHVHHVSTGLHVKDKDVPPSEKNADIKNSDERFDIGTSSFENIPGSVLLSEAHPLKVGNNPINTRNSAGNVFAGDLQSSKLKGIVSADKKLETIGRMSSHKSRKHRKKPRHSSSKKRAHETKSNFDKRFSERKHLANSAESSAGCKISENHGKYASATAQGLVLEDGPSTSKMNCGLSDHRGRKRTRVRSSSNSHSQSGSYNVGDTESEITVDRLSQQHSRSVECTEKPLITQDYEMINDNSGTDNSESESPQGKQRLKSVIVCPKNYSGNDLKAIVSCSSNEKINCADESVTKQTPVSSTVCANEKRTVDDSLLVEINCGSSEVDQSEVNKHFDDHRLHREHRYQHKKPKYKQEKHDSK